MTRHLLTILLLITLFSCSDKQADKTAVVIKEYSETHCLKKEKEFSYSEEKSSFKNIADVINDKKSYAWVNSHSDSTSCAIHFKLGENDSLVSIEYSPECWIMFPYAFSKDKITIFWEYRIDTKYDFNIVKAVERIGKKYAGKAFIILELTNDTTLKATYPIPEIIKPLNSADKDRVLFPKEFYANKNYI